MSDADDTVLVGRIVGVHGIKGWVKVLSHTDPAENVFDYAPWSLGRNKTYSVYTVEQSRRQGKGLVAKLEGIDDRDQALTLRGQDIIVPRAVLPPASADEYYWTDLIGLAVTTTSGVALGKIVQMMATGANDVMVVKDAERQRLIPFIRNQVVSEIDQAAGSMVVDWDPEF